MSTCARLRLERDGDRVRLVVPIWAGGDDGGLGWKAEIKALKHAAEKGIGGSFLRIPSRNKTAPSAAQRWGRLSPGGRDLGGEDLRLQLLYRKTR